MIEFDMRELESASKTLGITTDQVPFAYSVAMNKAVRETRLRLINETWPSSVTVRNPNFLRVALRTKFSSKRDLEVEINDVLGRGSLVAHAEGGTKEPKGRNLAIPTRAVQRTQQGVRRDQRPRNLRRSFRLGNAIYQRVGGARVRLMYLLRPSVTIRKDVPFYEDFARFMKEGIMRNIGSAVERAMSTRRQ